MTRPKSKARSVSAKRMRSKTSSAAPTKAAARLPTSKQSACLALLKRSEGATIRELQKLTNWQEHSVRAFLAGTVKKRLGLDIASVKEERGRVYRIVIEGSPAPLAFGL
jgi:2-keto-3-deoxy-galactonokinase